MPDDLTALPPEDFVRLAVARGGLDLDEVAGELSPAAAEVLRLIAAPAPPPTRGQSRSPEPMRSLDRGGFPPLPPLPGCDACGYTGRLGDRFCRQCGRPLGAPITLDDLVAHGQLTTEQARELRDVILHHQSHYLAGTRYSVFG